MQQEVDNVTVRNESFSDVFENSSGQFVDHQARDDGFVVSYGTEIRITFLILACISVITSLTAITLLYRSKRIHYAAKFLITGLLVFDILFMVLSAVRKFITNPIITSNTQFVVILFLQSTYLTVFLMSVERYFLILKPMRYVQIVTRTFVKKTVLFIWISGNCLCIFIRYGVCYIRFQTELVFTSPGFCAHVISRFLGIMLCIVLIISCICYVKIFKCILSKESHKNVNSKSIIAKVVSKYRSTLLVLAYLILIIITAFVNGTIILFIQFGILRQTMARLSYEFVCVFSCILDPILYVLWFKECRLQLLTFLAVFLKRYKDRAQQMKIEVYDIVTADLRDKQNVRGLAKQTGENTL